MIGSILYINWMVFLTSKILIPEVPSVSWGHQILGISYEITTLDNSIKEFICDLNEEGFDEAFIQRVAQDIKLHPSGYHEYCEFWSNGTVKASLPYKDGKAHGHVHAWYENGVDAFKGYFHEGVKQGIHISFYKTDQSSKQKRHSVLVYNKKGELSGQQQRSYESGDLWVSVDFKNGKIDGELFIYSDDKQKKDEFLYRLYRNNKVVTKEYDPDRRPFRNYDTPDSRHLRDIEKKIIQRAYKELQVTACGAGGSCPFDIESVSISFVVKEKGSLYKARKLMIKIREMYLDVINKHEKIRPYLRNYPFLIDDIEVSLSFSDPKSSKPSEIEVVHAMVGRKSEIYYYTKDLKKKNAHKLFMKESYHEVKNQGAKDKDKVSIKTSTK